MYVPATISVKITKDRITVSNNTDLTLPGANTADLTILFPNNQKLVITDLVANAPFITTNFNPANFREDIVLTYSEVLAAFNAGFITTDNLVLPELGFTSFLDGYYDVSLTFGDGTDGGYATVASLGTYNIDTCISTAVTSYMDALCDDCGCGGCGSDEDKLVTDLVLLRDGIKLDASTNNRAGVAQKVKNASNLCGGTKVCPESDISGCGCTDVTEKLRYLFQATFQSSAIGYTGYDPTDTIEIDILDGNGAIIKTLSQTGVLEDGTYYFRFAEIDTTGELATAEDIAQPRFLFQQPHAILPGFDGWFSYMYNTELNMNIFSRNFYFNFAM